MKRMNVFQLVASSILMSLLGVLVRNAVRRDNAVNNAIRRVRNAPDGGRILSRNQVVELMKFGVYAKDLMEAREALRSSVDRFSIDLDDQVDNFRKMLSPDRRAPDVSEEESTRNAESELDRLLNILPPRQKGPSFFYAGSPDPNEALGGMASDETGDPRGHRTTRERGNLIQDTYTSTDSRGNTKVITETYEDGELLGIVVNVYDRYGRLTQESREYHTEVEGTVARWERVLGHGYDHYWRYGDEKDWRRGLPPGNPRDWPRRGRPAPELYPRDDGSETGEVPHFFLKLPNGGYAMCYVANPVSGLSYCTLLSRNQVNIEEGMAPVIDASDLIIRPEDLVINPDPDSPLVHELPTREEIEHRFERPDPGPRPAVPEVP